MPPRKGKEKKLKPVVVGKKLRGVHKWFEAGAADGKVIKSAAKQRKLRTLGPQLSPAALKHIADGLERIQRWLNAFETAHKSLSAKLLAHWAYTGVVDIEGELGKTLIFLSYQLSLDQSVIEKGLTEGQWRSVTRRIVDPEALLMLAKDDEALRRVVLRALRVAMPKVSIVPPSSRRPKSGQPEEEEEEEDEE